MKKVINFLNQDDKQLHILVSFLLAIKSPPLAIICGIGKEIIDSQTKGNHFCKSDLLADVIGIILACPIHYLIYYVMIENELINVFRTIINSFDLVFMLVVNLITYGCIKLIDEFNGVKQVSTWCKRLVAFIVSIAVSLVFVLVFQSDSKTIFCSTFLSFVSWDYIFKPMLKRISTKLDYKKSE